ncbi:twinfilin-2-A-like isoform X2 [Varroa destructor]|uniref:ADF-H domain-containing protein n=1 Tax=Varroa destructor TaxID=109461 RepID=A0A7M7KJ79_VARDE|nr:twinfilin-2-A-like isoform X2 [Varroa destructor]
MRRWPVSLLKPEILRSAGCSKWLSKLNSLSYVMSYSFKTTGKLTLPSRSTRFSRYVPQLTEERQPCFLFFRLDKHGEWLMISFSPDDAPVRLKMLYASTKATLKKAFAVDSEFVATSKEDATLAGYEAHLRAENAPPPMTNTERELAEVRLNESFASVGIDAKQQTLKGLELPISDEAIDGFFSLKEGKINYLQVGIDIGNEHVVVHDRGMLGSADELTSRVPQGEPRYHLFSFKHIHDNQRVVSTFFIYTIPAGNYPVKVKMLYSSCKAPLIKDIEGKIEIPLARKLELDDLSELSEQRLLDQLYPRTDANKGKFARPAGPAGRQGGRRLVK